MVRASQDDSIYEARSAFSFGRLDELREHVAQIDVIRDRIAIFCAGSYGRGEATPESDLDLFFIRTDRVAIDQPTPRTDTYRLFGRIIDIAADLDFPSFSDDCKYLEIHDMADIVDSLGSRTDDYLNYFTVRMLLLLESTCIYGEEDYSYVKEILLSSYYKDYHDHQLTFRPTFLINDISRFWKTLLLNYEHRRHQDIDNDSQATGAVDSVPISPDDKVRAKIKNFKLKFSRLTTCFATIAAIGSHTPPVSKETILDIVSRTPHERLLDLTERGDEQIAGIVSQLRSQYSQFLEQTALSEATLYDQFRDKERVRILFDSAEEYRWTMFRLLKLVDRMRPRSESNPRGLIDTLTI